MAMLTKCQWTILSLPVLIALVGYLAHQWLPLRNPDSLRKLVTSRGYPFETHYVTTRDGYILGVHRLPHGKEGAREPSGKKPVVFFQHGLLAASSRVLIGDPRKSLPYVLADLGFDVWLGNSRGNTYSRNHTSLDPDSQSEFWDFSWDESARGDLPAVLDHVTRLTNQERVFYIGHSMGATMLLVAAEAEAETGSQQGIQSKIHEAFFLAPAVYLTHSASASRWSWGLRVFDWLRTHFGFHEVPQSRLVPSLGRIFCQEDRFHWPVFHQCCMGLVQVVLGLSPDQVDVARLTDHLNFMPEGMSTKSSLHFLQLTVSHNFSRYDHGPSANQALYGQLEPLAYNLTRAVQNLPPISIFYGDGDEKVDLRDVERLVRELGPVGVKLAHKVDREGWAHGDFVTGLEAKEVVYDKIVREMERVLEREQAGAGSVVPEGK